MPTRDQLRPADLTVVLNGVTYGNSAPRAIGWKQSISALNNVGKFVPGTFRANPVVLEKFVALGEPTSSTSEDVYQANKGKINGHVCALLARSMHMTPASNFDSYTSWDATAAGHSLQKAYASMKEAELDVGVMLGELRETIEGLRNPIQALRGWLHLWNKLSRRGKRPKPSDHLNMLTGSWLEWRYGIQPLILSIQDIIEHVCNQSLAAQEKLLRQRGKIAYERNHKVTGSVYPEKSYLLEGTTEIVVKHKYVTNVFYKMTRPLTWQERYGLDAFSIPGIALELTRLSFVWDWFFSVGDWLGSITPSDARTVHGSVTSQKCTVVSTTRVTAIKFFGLVPAKYSGGLYELTYEKLDRRINQPLALTPLVNRQALSLKRTIDGISLLWQSLPKPRR